MKVCMVAAYFPPYIGGYARHVFELSKALVRQGVRVVVVTTRAGGGKPREEICGVEIHRFPCLNIYKLPYVLVPSALKVSKVARELEADVLHFHGRLFSTSVLGVVSKNLFLGDFPSVLTLHGVNVYYGKFLTGLAHLYDLTVSRYLAKSVNYVIAVSGAVRNYALSYGVPQWKISVIPGGVNPELFTEKAVKRKEELGLPVEGLVLGFVGRLYPTKGCDVLIKASKKVVEKFGDLKVVVVGDGPQRGELEKLTLKLGIRENIVFLGERRDVEGLIALFDVVVIPSIAEGFGLTILEATAAGKPVVASNVGGHPEAALGNTTLVEPNSPDKLAEALMKVLDNPPSREVVEKARETVKERYEWSKIAGKIRGIYEEAVREARKE